MALVFPETSDLVRKRPPPTTLTLQRLLLVTYIFGGISALIALTSKLILQPLFQQLVEDRRSYAGQALNRLIKLNASLSSSVSYIPPSKSVTKHYVDQQVQTDTNIKNSSDPVYSNPNSSDPNAVDTNQLLESLRRLNAAMDLETSIPLKNELNELSSYVQSLSYPASLGISGLNSKPASTRPNVVAQVKKEIRSVKGSLLSMRK